MFSTMLFADYEFEITIGVIVLLIIATFFGFIVLLMKQYKRCPSNRVLVIYGRTQKGKASTTVHGGAALPFCVRP